MTPRGGVTPAPPAWERDRMTAALDDLLEGFRLRAEPLGARIHIETLAEGLRQMLADVLGDVAEGAAA